MLTCRLESRKATTTSHSSPRVGPRVASSGGEAARRYVVLQMAKARHFNVPLCEILQMIAESQPAPAAST